MVFGALHLFNQSVDAGWVAVAVAAAGCRLRGCCWLGWCGWCVGFCLEGWGPCAVLKGPGSSLGMW